MKRPDLLSLRPSQFVLGMKEVEYKIAKMHKMKQRELRDFCDAHVIPLVLGPGEEPFILDHHHFARSCWELGIEEYSVRVIEDLSKLSRPQFWNKMVARDWTYLHDQFGLGPHSPSALPLDIRCLADDPFRSLVWAVIEKEGIEKQKIPFFEFKWAQFFRLNLSVQLHSKSDFTDATNLAFDLASSQLADHLAGFTGKRSGHDAEKAAVKLAKLGKLSKRGSQKRGSQKGSRKKK